LILILLIFLSFCSINFLFNFTLHLKMNFILYLNFDPYYFNCLLFLLGIFYVIDIFFHVNYTIFN
jgi:hypothetical protein